MKDLTAIEVVADRTAGTRPDEGFLQVRRLVLRNRYADGSTSADYPCDIVSRTRTDAVAVVLYEIDAARRVHVALKTGVRPPVTLRRGADLTHPDDDEHLLLAEIVAGMLEPEDAGPGGIERRAALECMEEAGYSVDPDAIRPLGAAMFASPGITDERVHYRAVETPLAAGTTPTGDGSVMEEAGAVLILPLDEAIRRCRDGAIPDAKTELALLRLCEQIGYLPQLGCFIDELPPRPGHSIDR